MHCNKEGFLSTFRKEEHLINTNLLICHDPSALSSQALGKLDFHKKISSKNWFPFLLCSVQSRSAMRDPISQKQYYQVLNLEKLCLFYASLQELARFQQGKIWQLLLQISLLFVKSLTYFLLARNRVVKIIFQGFEMRIWGPL